MKQHEFGLSDGELNNKLAALRAENERLRELAVEMLVALATAIPSLEYARHIVTSNKVQAMIDKAIEALAVATPRQEGK